jgi:hypothetical protein
MDSELHLHRHVNYIFFYYVKLLGLLLSVTFPFLSLGCLCILYFTLVRCKLVCSSVVWNSVSLLMPTNWKGFSVSLQPFVLLLSFQMSITVRLVLEYLKFHTWRKSVYRVDAPFLIQVSFGFKFCLMLETVGLGVPALYIRDSLCSISALQVKIGPLDMLQLLMLFEGALLYLEPKLFPSIICYNDTLLNY